MTQHHVFQVRNAPPPHQSIFRSYY